MKYQIWIIARDPKTLQPIAEVLVFGHEDCIKAEEFNAQFTCVAEIANRLFGPVVLGQNPIYGTETRIPDGNPYAGIEELPIGWSMSWIPGAEPGPGDAGAEPGPAARPPFPRI